jgi:hypothetical protein
MTKSAGIAEWFIKNGLFFTFFIYHPQLHEVFTTVASKMIKFQTNHSSTPNELASIFEF